MTCPDMSIKVERKLHDMRILGRVLCASGTRLAPTEAERRPCMSCSAAEQFVGMYLHKMNTLQRVLKYSIIVG